MKSFPVNLSPAILLALTLAAGCISGKAETKLNVSGKYKFITQPVQMSCKQKNTGLAFSMSPLPGREFMVDVTGSGGEILLNSVDFNWNLINLRVSETSATQSATGMAGTVDDNGVFFAETTESWTNTGTAGPLQITQRYEGKFTETGVAGTYTAHLLLQNYNTECDGSAAFEGQKLS